MGAPGIVPGRQRFPTMEVDKGYKLHKATATDVSRFGFDNIMVDPARERACATNGKLLAVIPITTDDAEKNVDPFGVSAEAWKTLVKGSTRTPATLNVLDDSVHVINKVLTVFPVVDMQDLPKCDSIIKSMPAPTSDTIRIGLNPKFLHLLADALGTDTVTLEVTPDHNGTVKTMVKVHPSADDDHGQYGVIMPIVCRA